MIFQNMHSTLEEPLRLFKSMYVITNSGKLFDYQLTECLLEAGFILSECQMSIYYNYALDGSKSVVLSYVDYCVYWYTNEDLRKKLLILWERDSM